MTEFSPREIVSELDRYIVGQGEAKRAVPLPCVTAGAVCNWMGLCGKR